MLKSRKTVGKSVVSKSRKLNNLNSKFDCVPKKLINETEHAVTVEGGKMFHKKDVADCSQLMLDVSFQKPNKKNRGIIRSSENGQFKKTSNNIDISHTVETGRDEQAKERERRGQKNPHSQSWLEAKEMAARKENLASTGSSDSTVLGEKAQTSAQADQGTQSAQGEDPTAETIATDGTSTTAAGVNTKNMAAGEADLPVQEKDSVDADKQAFCNEDNLAKSAANATTPKSTIFSANAPIKPTPGNYTDNEDSSLVRRSNRLPTAKRVNKFGGVNYN